MVLTAMQKGAWVHGGVNDESPTVGPSRLDFNGSFMANLIKARPYFLGVARTVNTFDDFASGDRSYLFFNDRFR